MIFELCNAIFSIFCVEPEEEIADKIEESLEPEKRDKRDRGEREYGRRNPRERGRERAPL